jgi:antimicrobial peptide system SdpA family protein
MTVNYRKKATVATVVVAALFWMTVVAYATHGAIRFNPIALPSEKRLAVPSVLPQGWRFFTRDPQESRLHYYASTPQGWAVASIAPHAEPRNYFGLDRASRAQGVEAALLLAATQQNDWNLCDADVQTCLNLARSGAAVRNTSPRPTLCGEIAFARQAMVPWAWSHAAATTVMPSQILRMVVTC